MNNFTNTLTKKILLGNAAVFFCWRFRGISEQFMAKNFAYDPHNIRQGRVHTFFTSIFSNRTIPSFLFDSLMIYSLGTNIQTHFGANRMLKLIGLGAILGAFFMHATTPRIQGVLIPLCGSYPILATFITFMSMQNLNQMFQFFVFPIQARYLILTMVIMSLFEPGHRSLGGIIAGILGFALYKRGSF